LTPGKLSPNLSNLTSAYETSFLTHNEQAFPLGSRSPLEPTSSLRLTCLLARFCRLRGERLYQRSVRCFSGLGLEMGRWSCWCCCELRTAARRQSVQFSGVHVAFEVHRTDDLLMLLEIHCEHIIDQINSCGDDKSHSLVLFSKYSHDPSVMMQSGKLQPRETVVTCSVCTFDAISRHESNGHAISINIYPYNAAAIPVWQQSNPRASPLSSHAFLCSPTQRPIFCRMSQLASLSSSKILYRSSGYVYMYTPRRPRSSARSWRGAARHFRTFLIPFHHINLLLQAYAAFGSCGLVVPATSPFVAPSATSAAAGNCPCGFTCARTASVTPNFVCVGKRTALRAFSVCSPEGRYLGSRRPICRFLR
jgi:hypothetical protein